MFLSTIHTAYSFYLVHHLQPNISKRDLVHTPVDAACPGPQLVAVSGAATVHLVTQSSVELKTKHRRIFHSPY